MSYRYRNNSTDFSRTKVTFGELAYEHNILTKMINSLIKHAGVDPEWIQESRKKAKASHENLMRYNMTIIEQKAALQDDLDEYTYGDTKVKSGYSKVNKQLGALIYNAMVRQERILLLQEKYLNLDEVQMEADKGGLKASSLFSNINTAHSYYGGGGVMISGKKDADPMDVDYTEEVEDEMTYCTTTQKRVSTGKKRVKNWTIKYNVDQNWMDDVYENKIQYTDIGGKQCLVTQAKEVEEHELKDQGIKLYDCTVIYTKIPVSDNHWRIPAGQPRTWFNVEKRHVAVQSLPSGGVQQASGKDASWAIRTMKMRMKSTMMKQMGLK